MLALEPIPPSMASALEGRTILQIIPALETGGAERTAVDVAEALARVGARALVATEGGRLVGELQAKGGEWAPFPAAAKNPLTGTWAAKTGPVSWKVTFTPDNAYVAKATGVIRGTPMTFVAGAGKVAFSGGQVTFRDRRGCSGRQAVAVYNWTRRPGTLRLTPVREQCVNRRAVLTAVLRLVR